MTLASLLGPPRDRRYADDASTGVPRPRPPPGGGRARVPFSELHQSLRETIPTRSESAQNRQRNHPRPPLMETTRVDGVKAPDHRETPSYDGLVGRGARAGPAHHAQNHPPRPVHKPRASLMTMYPALARTFGRGTPGRAGPPGFLLRCSARAEWPHISGHETRLRAFSRDV